MKLHQFVLAWYFSSGCNEILYFVQFLHVPNNDCWNLLHFIPFSIASFFHLCFSGLSTAILLTILDNANQPSVSYLTHFQQYRAY